MIVFAIIMPSVYNLFSQNATSLNENLRVLLKLPLPPYFSSCAHAHPLPKGRGERPENWVREKHPHPIFVPISDFKNTLMKISRLS
jgi:hypothetical protein